jgi:hypothetical protein
VNESVNFTPKGEIHPWVPGFDSESIFFRNFKLTLLELERLYNLLIEVEDCEKKLLALPTNTLLRVQVTGVMIF